MTIVNIEIEKPADAIIIAAPYAPAGPVVVGTSHTANDVATGGAYTFRMDQAGLGWIAGMRARASAQEDPLTWIEGVVTSFDGTNLVITGDISAGFGIWDAWNINIAGEPGQTGPQGPPGTAGTSGVPEAPNDNLAYGRRNTSWVQVLMYSGDVVDGGNF